MEQVQEAETLEGLPPIPRRPADGRGPRCGDLTALGDMSIDDLVGDNDPRKAERLGRGGRRRTGQASSASMTAR